MLLNIDLNDWITNAGYWGIVLIIFLETGVFACFFLPGDSLLFSVGLLASQGIFNIWFSIFLITFSGIAGYFLSYWVGKKLSGWLLRREDSFWFKKRYLSEAAKFYDKHGGKSLILGRLLPVIRSFVPVVAGMTHMNYLRFTILNITGALLWALGVTLSGYYLGHLIPDADKYVLLIAVLIIFLSASPVIFRVLKTRLLNRNLQNL